MFSRNEGVFRFVKSVLYVIIANIILLTGGIFCNNVKSELFALINTVINIAFYLC